MNESLVDDEFIRKVVDDYSDMIFRVSFQYVRNTLDAEDVAQEVLLSLLDYLSRASFESDEHTKAWLIRVTINKSKNVAKLNARRRNKAAQLAYTEDVQPQFDDLESVLDKLSAINREVIYLHYYEGYSAKEIANFMNMTEKAIFKRLSRSRSELKEFLSEGGESV